MYGSLYFRDQTLKVLPAAVVRPDQAGMAFFTMCKALKQICILQPVSFKKVR